MVLLGGWILGPAYGAAAAGIGSMLADLLAGFAYYAPGTLAVKGAMAAAAGMLFQRLNYRSGLLLPAQLASGIAAESIMVAGYFGYACLLLGKGLGAAASVPGNVVQGVFGLAGAVTVYVLLSRGRVLVHL